MLVLRLAAVLLALVALPSAATASTVSLESGQVHFVTAPGEAAAVTATYYDGLDPAPPVEPCAPDRPVTCVGDAGVTPGPGCVATSVPSVVACAGEIAGMTIEGGDGSDAVAVSAPGRPLTVRLGAGDDLLMRSPAAGELDAPASSVDVDGGPGADDLTIAAGASLVLSGGDGDDRLQPTLAANAPIPATVDGGEGADRFTMSFTGATRGLHLTGGGDDDRFVVRYAPRAGDPALPAPGSVSITCGPGLDHVNEEIEPLPAGTPTPVAAGMELASDCPPAPQTLLSGQVVSVPGGGRIVVPVDFPEAVTLVATYQTGLEGYEPDAVRVAVPAGATSVTLPVPRRTLTLLRRFVVPKHTSATVPVTVELLAGDADDETWSESSVATGGVLTEPNLLLALDGGPLAPRLGVSAGAGVVSGRVFVTVRGKRRELLGGDLIPLGSTVDARRGRVRITAAADAGTPQMAGEFYDGMFVLTQRRRPPVTTVLRLSERLTGCARSRSHARRAQSAAKRRKKRRRRLWGDGEGRFQTAGQHSSATVRGTRWLVQDTCGSTVTRVARGVVEVRDKRKRKTVLVPAGGRYVARP